MAEGTSPWLDGFHRGMIASGHLAGLIAGAGLRGATWNPAAMAAQFSEDTAYQDQFAKLAWYGVSTDSAVWAATVCDLRSACTSFRAVFEETRGYDGLVSMDIDPRHANDHVAMTAEAVELARWVDQPNLLVKIPATAEGLAAVSDCIGLGIGVHATGVFSVRRYGQVVDAYFKGLERALAAGRSLPAITSVSSLPVGSVDRAVDRRLRLVGSRAALALSGRTALAVARMMHHEYEERLGSDRWRALRAHGARPQRLLWTDSALADPALSRDCYVEGLVSWGTGHAMTRSTLDEAVRLLKLRGDTLMGQLPAARTVLASLSSLGISYPAVARELEEAQTAAEAESWRRLGSAVGARLRGAAVSTSARQQHRGRAAGAEAADR